MPPKHTWNSKTHADTRRGIIKTCGGPSARDVLGQIGLEQQNVGGVILVGPPRGEGELRADAVRLSGSRCGALWCHLGTTPFADWEE